jgi:hypothetical protein
VSRDSSKRIIVGLMVIGAVIVAGALAPAGQSSSDRHADCAYAVVSSPVYQTTPVLLFKHELYRKVLLFKAKVRIGRPVGLGSLYPCLDGIPSVELLVRLARLRGINPRLAVADRRFAGFVIYVRGDICRQVRSERELLRCLRRA